MASINISIKEEAYQYLQSLKTKDKSFSDVILQFKNQKGNNQAILNLFKEPRNSHTDTSISFRDSFNKRMQK